MHRVTRCRIAVVAALMTLPWGAAALLAAEVPVLDLVKQMPAQDAAAAAELSAKLVQAGPAGVKQIVALIIDPAKTQEKEATETNAKARYALHGLAIYAARPGAETERKMLVETLASLLATDLPAEIKGFLIRQLQLAGSKESIEALAPFLLAEEAMCEYAAQAMQAIGDPSAVDALRDALPKAKGPNRLTILQALGVLRDSKAVPALLKAAADDSRETRLAALFALANVGDPGATDALLKASTPESLYERAKATDAVLLLGQRLVEADKKPEAEKIYRHLWTTRTGAAEAHVRCGALRGLVAALGEKATGDVLAATKDESPDVRAVAAQLVATLPGATMTQQLIASLKDAPPAARVDTLDLLARRADRAALPTALEAMKDQDAAVRKAAIRAVAAIGRDEAIPPLVAALGAADSGERQEARNALILIPGDKASAAIAAALAPATPQVRVELLAVLAGRGARTQLDPIFACTRVEEEAVRIAALDAIGTIAQDPSLPPLLELLVGAKTDRERSAAEKAADSICRRAPNKDRCAEALLAALAKADAPAKCALLRVLGGTGSPKALEPLRRAVQDAQPDIQEAAVRALARWPDADVAGDLLALAKDAKDEKLRVLALQGYIRVLGLPSKRPVEQTLKMYQEGMAVAARPDEKKAILGALGEIQDPGAFKMVAACLGDKAVRPEAEVAVIKLSDRLRDTKDDAARKTIHDALQDVIQNSTDERRRGEATKNLDRWYKPKGEKG